MMMRSILALLLLGANIISTGCSLDDDDVNFYYSTLEITDAALPTSFDLNQTYEIKVTYRISNDCTAFEGFDISREDVTVRDVVAVGLVRTDLDSCTETDVERESSFKFSVIYTQPYVFRFYKGENENGEAEFFEVTVPVN